MLTNRDFVPFGFLGCLRNQVLSHSIAAEQITHAVPNTVAQTGQFFPHSNTLCTFKFSALRTALAACRRCWCP